MNGHLLLLSSSDDENISRGNYCPAMRGFISDLNGTADALSPLTLSFRLVTSVNGDRRVVGTVKIVHRFRSAIWSDSSRLSERITHARRTFLPTMVVNWYYC